MQLRRFILQRIFALSSGNICANVTRKIAARRIKYIRDRILRVFTDPRRFLGKYD